MKVFECRLSERVKTILRRDQNRGGDRGKGRNLPRRLNWTMKGLPDMKYKICWIRLNLLEDGSASY
jgi:hypothetical protein